MSKPKIKYETATSGTLVGLDENVNKKVEQGWELQGGVAVCVELEPYAEDSSRKVMVYTGVQLW